MLGALGAVTVVAMLVSIKIDLRLVPLMWLAFFGFAGVHSFL